MFLSNACFRQTLRQNTNICIELSGIEAIRSHDVVFFFFFHFIMLVWSKYSLLLLTNIIFLPNHVFSITIFEFNNQLMIDAVFFQVSSLSLYTLRTCSGGPPYYPTWHSHIRPQPNITISSIYFSFLVYKHFFKKKNIFFHLKSK